MGPEEATRLVVDNGVAVTIVGVFICLTLAMMSLLGWVLKRTLNKALCVNGDGKSSLHGQVASLRQDVQDLRWTMLQRPCMTDRPCPDERIEELRHIGRG